MNTITAIIEVRGGFEKLRDHHIHIDNPPWMPLSIEFIGRGPRGGMLISVMHWYEQNGDTMRDPDVVMERMPSGEWLPISFQNDGMAFFQDAVAIVDGEVRENDRAVRDIRDFAAEWDRNLAEQGFLTAATKQ